MRLKMMFSLVLFIAILGNALSDDNILCTKTSCDDVSCDELSTKCKTQNATHNGVFFTSPTTCNCCQYCLDNLSEGEPCSTGDVASPVPKEICGPGLTCNSTIPDDTDGLCLPMNTTCTLKQRGYDEKKKNGTLGTMELRQECDAEGDFVPYKCIPGQTCYCVDLNGTRIFGEAEFTTLPSAQLHCKCSRDYLEASKIIGRDLNPLEFFHCSSDGNYANLQCIGDQCLCVDSYDGAPTYPADDTVNITDISKETLKCYKNEEPAVFYTKCEQEYIPALADYKNLEKNNYSMIIGFQLPKCDLDGTYKPVQENKTHKYCVDKEGTVLTAVSKTEFPQLADNMNCKCIRASLIATTNEKLKCDVNGNYLQKQCRRGKCRCVDEDGNQVCKSLNCEGDDNADTKFQCPK